MAQDAVFPSSQESLAKRVVWAAFLGFLVDMFDIYLPILALAPIMSYFLPSTVSATTSTTIYFVVFLATLVGRPVGSFIFGHYGDKIGRKKTTIIAVSGFGVLTLIMGLLPGYVQWGIGAIYVLTALRFICGIFLGGEYTAASPLAMEYSPKEKRGFYGGFITNGYPYAFLIMTLVTTLMLTITPLKGGAYALWGWRIPFVVGAILGLLYVLWFNKNIPESEVWMKSAKTKEPLKALFSGESFRNLMQVFLLMTGLWFTFEMVGSALPGVLIQILKVPAITTNNMVMIAMLFLILGQIYAGIWSQHSGRRVVLIWFGVINIVIGSIAYYLAMVFYSHIVWEAILIIILNLTASGWGLVPSYINERFKTAVRSSGYGIGYSLSVVIPSFYTFYFLWLKHLMPYQFGAIVLFVLGGILIIIGAAMGPETKDVNFEPSE